MEALHRRALAGREKVLGPEHPGTLNSSKNLAAVLKEKGDLPGAVSLLREFARKFPDFHYWFRYNLACYEYLTGNVEEAKRLITEEIAAKPAAREQALRDDDLKAIRDFIRSLPGPSDAGDQNPT